MGAIKALLIQNNDETAHCTIESAPRKQAILFGNRIFLYHPSMDMYIEVDSNFIAKVNELTTEIKDQTTLFDGTQESNR